MPAYPIQKLCLLFCLCLTLGICSHLPVSPPLDPSALAYGRIKTLIIDPGHGGKDPGTIGANHYEKDVALQVSLKLRDMLKAEAPHIKVVLTREDDRFIELHHRAKIAKENEGDFFISVHCNAFPIRSRFGTETYVMGVNQGQEGMRTIIAENESILFEKNYREMYGGFDPSSPEGYIYFRLLKNAFRQESMHLAGIVEGRFKRFTQRHSRGVKQAPFLVLWQCGMPAILTEIGFLSNTEEEKYIASDSGQNNIARSITQAIKVYNQEIEAQPDR